jgi:predicted  nucleic acid-binding Zn-ribbon protein
MGPTLSALVDLQVIEQDLTQLRRRQRARRNAVTSQEARIDKHHQERDALKASCVNRQKEADSLELDLRESEERINHLRVALNSAKTNKEYAAVLTEINTHKADNAKLEDKALKIISDVDETKKQIETIDGLIAEEEKKLEEIKSSIAEELARLDGVIGELVAKRTEAAAKVAPSALELFDRLAGQYYGEAMARVQVSGKKPPYSYICGGCFMSLNAEHANALQSKDEVRQCDNCERILYMDETDG